MDRFMQPLHFQSACVDLEPVLHTCSCSTQAYCGSWLKEAFGWNIASLTYLTHGLLEQA